MLFNNDYLDDLLELGVGDIGKYCGDYLDAETLSEHLERMEPLSRKELCQYLGVGESTMTGWLKEDRIPLMAKEAFMLPLVLRVLGDEIRRLRYEAPRARILKNGDIYQIVQFVPDECGEAIGNVIADNIAHLQNARMLLSGWKALRLLADCDNETIEYALEMTEQASFSERLYELRKDIKMCLWYAADYESWKTQNTPVDLSDLSTLFLTPKASAEGGKTSKAGRQNDENTEEGAS